MDDDAAQKLDRVRSLLKVVTLAPFLLVALGIILGLVFMFLMCRQKLPVVRRRGKGRLIAGQIRDAWPAFVLQSTAAERQPLLSS